MFNWLFWEKRGVWVKLVNMVSKVKKQTNSVIDNSKNFQVITNTLYWVLDKKTGKVKEECRTEKKKIN